MNVDCQSSLAVARDERWPGALFKLEGLAHLLSQPREEELEADGLEAEGHARGYTQGRLDREAFESLDALEAGYLTAVPAFV